MTENDLLNIMDLEKSMFSDPYPADFLRKCIRQPDYVALAATEKGVVVGYLLALSVDVYELLRIAVVSQKRNGGIGTSLLSSLKDKSVSLEVAADNQKALLFYQSCGFHIVKARHNYYGEGRDGIVCVRPKI